MNDFFNSICLHLDAAYEGLKCYFLDTVYDQKLQSIIVFTKAFKNEGSSHSSIQL